VSRSLTRVINWGHELLAEKVAPGQLAVDLTAGNGYDTLMLTGLVRDAGQVIAFDIQSEALHSTRRYLRENGQTVRLWQAAPAPLPAVSGVDLVEAGHEQMQNYLPKAPAGIIANLGFYPSGDRQLVTRAETTLQALQQSCEVLLPGGRLVVVVYPSHPGGAEEGAAVDTFFASLNPDDFRVLQLKVINRPEAPYLLVAEKCV